MKQKQQDIAVKSKGTKRMLMTTTIATKRREYDVQQYPQHEEETTSTNRKNSAENDNCDDKYENNETNNDYEYAAVVLTNDNCCTIQKSNKLSGEINNNDINMNVDIVLDQNKMTDSSTETATGFVAAMVENNNNEDDIINANNRDISNDDLILYPVTSAYHELRKEQKNVNDIINQHWYIYSTVVEASKRQYILQNIIHTIQESGRRILFCVSSFPENNKDVVTRRQQQQQFLELTNGEDDCHNNNKLIIPLIDRVVGRILLELRDTMNQRMALIWERVYNSR